jgi:hypothetical protein
MRNSDHYHNRTTFRQQLVSNLLWEKSTSHLIPQLHHPSSGEQWGFSAVKTAYESLSQLLPGDAILK